MMLVALAYLLVWGLAMGAAAAGLVGVAIVSCGIMAVLCFRKELHRFHGG